MKSRWPFFVKAITCLLIISFSFQDIVSANPEIFSASPSQNNKLAPESLFAGDPESIETALIKLVEDAIENSGHVGRRSIAIQGVSAILTRHDIWLKANKIRYDTLRGEALIQFPSGRAIRYYDPGVASRRRDGFDEVGYDQVGNIHKQLLSAAAGARISDRELTRRANTYRNELVRLKHLFDRIEHLRYGLTVIKGRYYRSWERKKAAIRAKEAAISAGLNSSEAILDRLDNVGLQPLRVSEDMPNIRIEEDLDLRAAEIALRLDLFTANLSGDSRLRNKAEEFRNCIGQFLRHADRRERLSKFREYAGILRRMAGIEVAKSGELIFMPRASGVDKIGEVNRRELFRIYRLLDAMIQESAQLRYSQREFDLGRDRTGYQGSAVEGKKMESAALMALFSLFIILPAHYVHASILTGVITFAYIMTMGMIPVMTNRYIESALSFRRGTVDYGLIRPFERARPIQELWDHDTDSHDKVSYYSYTLHSLFVYKEAMRRIPKPIQYYIYFHELLHGFFNIRTEIVAVPLTYCIPWIAASSALLTAYPILPHGSVLYLSALIAYNVAVPMIMKLAAVLIGTRESFAGHYLFTLDAIKGMNDEEIDYKISRYVHDSTREAKTGDMKYWRDWLRGSDVESDAELVECPDRPEDIIVIKASHIPESVRDRSVSDERGTCSGADNIERAIRASDKKLFRLIIAVDHPDIDGGESYYSRISETISEAGGIFARVSPGARFTVDIRSTRYDLTRLKDLMKLYRTRMDNRIKKRALAGEVHGNVKRLLELLEWLKKNEYSELQLMGDYLGKKGSFGLEAIDILSAHVKSPLKPKLKMLVGRGEYSFFLAMLGDERMRKLWPTSLILEGRQVMESLKRLSDRKALPEMPEETKRQIKEAADFNRMLVNRALVRDGKVTEKSLEDQWRQWYILHPRLIELAEFIIDNMRFVYREDEDHTVYIIGDGLSESFEHHGLRGIEALRDMEGEFRENARSGIRILKLMREIWMMSSPASPDKAETGKLEDIEAKVISLIEAERERNLILRKEIIPDRVLESMKVTAIASLEAGNLEGVIDCLAITLKETTAPIAALYQQIFKDSDTPLGEGLADKEERPKETFVEKQERRMLQGINAIVNLGIFTHDVQSLGQVVVSDEDGELILKDIDSLRDPRAVSERVLDNRRWDFDSFRVMEERRLRSIDEVMERYDRIYEMIGGRWYQRLARTTVQILLTLKEMASNIRGRHVRGYVPGMKKPGSNDAAGPGMEALLAAAFDRFSSITRDELRLMKSHLARGDKAGVVSCIGNIEAAVGSELREGSAGGLSIVMEDSINNLAGVKYLAGTTAKLGDETLRAIDLMNALLNELEKLKAAGRLREAYKARLSSGILDASIILGERGRTVRAKPQSKDASGKYDPTYSYSQSVSRAEELEERIARLMALVEDFQDEVVAAEADILELGFTLDEARVLAYFINDEWARLGIERSIIVDMADRTFRVDFKGPRHRIYSREEKSLWRGRYDSGEWRINATIRRYIEQGRAVEILNDGTVIRIRRNRRSRPRSPPLEARFRQNNIIDNIRIAKSPEVLRRALDSMENLPYLSPIEREDLIREAQKATISVILGRANIEERYNDKPPSCVYLHVRAGYTKDVHGLESTVWMGEELLRRMRPQDIALSLMEECQHIIRRFHTDAQGRWRGTHYGTGEKDDNDHSTAVLHGDNLYEMIEYTVSDRWTPPQEPDMPEDASAGVERESVDEGVVKIEYPYDFDGANRLRKGGFAIPVMVCRDHDRVVDWLSSLQASGVVTKETTIINFDTHSDSIDDWDVLHEGSWMRWLKDKGISTGRRVWVKSLKQSVFDRSTREDEIYSYGSDIYSSIEAMTAAVSGPAIITIDYDYIASRHGSNLTEAQIADMVRRITDSLLRTGIRPVAINFTYSPGQLIDMEPRGYGIPAPLTKEVITSAFIRSFGDAGYLFEALGGDKPTEQNAAVLPEGPRDQPRRLKSSRPDGVLPKSLIEDPGRDWLEIFGNDHPISVEIGPGNSMWILEQALAHPDRNYCALEADATKAYGLLNAVYSQRVGNLKIVYCDAKESLGRLFAPGGLSEIYINYPDASLLSAYMSEGEAGFFPAMERLLRKDGRLRIVSENSPRAKDIIAPLLRQAIPGATVVMEDSIPPDMPAASENGRPATAYIEIRTAVIEAGAKVGAGSELSSAGVFEAIHGDLKTSGVIARLREEKRKILLSKNLFREEDVGPLRSLLNEKIIQIADPDVIRNETANLGTPKDKLSCVVTRADFKTCWNGSAKSANKATVIVLDVDERHESPDRDFVYIYIEALVNFADAMASRERDRILRCGARLFGADAIKLQDLEKYLKDNDSIGFALNAILKLRPAEKVDMKRMEDYKKNTDRLLQSA